MFSPIRFIICSALCAAVLPASAQTTSPGITEPFLDVVISASVPGTIAKLNFKEGDAVKENDVIIELEKRQEELEVARRKLVWDSKVEANAAGEQVKTLKLDLDATRKLFETTKSLSKEQLEKKELEYKVAVAEHEKLIIAEDREKLEYDMAVEQLHRRKVTAPLTGTIAQLALDVGEDCKAQEPLARIVDTRRCYFTSNIDARLSQKLKLDQKVKLEIDSATKPVIVEGKITFISPVADPASGLLRVRAVFENGEAKVRPGISGRMIIEEK